MKRNEKKKQQINTEKVLYMFDEFIFIVYLDKKYSFKTLHNWFE